MWVLVSTTETVLEEELTTYARGPDGSAGSEVELSINAGIPIPPKRPLAAEPFRAETELLCASHPAARNPDTTVSRIALLIFPVRSDVSVSIFLFIAVLLAR